MSQHSFSGFPDTSSRLSAIVKARDEAKKEMVGALVCANNQQAIVAALDVEIARLRKLQHEDLHQWRAEYLAEIGVERPCDARGQE